MDGLDGQLERLVPRDCGSGIAQSYIFAMAEMKYQSKITGGMLELVTFIGHG